MIRSESLARLGAMLFTALIASSATAQLAPSGVVPRNCAPGATSRITVTGQGLDAVGRWQVDYPGATVAVAASEAAKVELDVTLPANVPAGPVRIWLASAVQTADPLTLFVDPAAPVIDNGQNHSLETAQPITSGVAITGTSDASLRDYYRLHVDEPTRLSAVVLTQVIGSTMDPVMRLLASDGTPLASFDDDAAGPDGGMVINLETAGDYLIEITDNKFAGGAGYYARIGNFPLVQHTMPLAVERGTQTSLHARGDGVDEAAATPITVDATDLAVTKTVVVNGNEGQLPYWGAVSVSPFPQVIEGQLPVAADSGEPSALVFPVGISGEFRESNEVDRFPLQGVKDARVRIEARARSLGSRALTKVELHNAAGGKVAETPVTEADEWSFEFAFPDDGIYTLVCRDLLNRGGVGFGYLVTVQPAVDFSVALKPDAAIREHYVLEPSRGACAIDLAITRRGYEGPITIGLAPAETGLSIINPTIAAGAKEARVYLQVSEGWNAATIQTIHLTASATDGSIATQPVETQALRRVKQPHVPFPSVNTDGAIVMAGVETSAMPWTFEPESALRFARPLLVNAARMQLKRTDESFKGAVAVLAERSAGPWQVAAKAENDIYTIDVTRPADALQEPSELELWGYVEHNGHGTIDRVTAAIEWFDPLVVTLTSEPTVVAGREFQANVSVSRDGGDPQPVTVSFAELPTGLTVAGPATIAADQSSAVVTFQLAADITAEHITIPSVATTTFRGQEIQIPAAPLNVQVIASPVKVEVQPTVVVLNGAKDRGQLVVTGYGNDGRIRDWSRDATFISSNPEVAEVRYGIVWPKGNGQCEVTATVGGHNLSIPVTVTAFDVAQPRRFETEVLVALSKQGCNAGACHGSPSGKGMFRLSLRAFDAKLDELTLIREDYGRRLNLIEPEESLLLLKPMMKVGHGGGLHLRKTDEAYPILRDWIAEGAHADPAGTPRCVRLEIYPNQKRVLDLKRGAQQMLVIAHFADGTTRDVTHLAAYESSNNLVATVDVNGLVTGQTRGEAAILARFLEHIESVPVMFVDDVEGFQWAAPEPQNYVDELVQAKLQQLKYVPSPVCNDEEFLRRVFIDVIGVPPTIEEAKAFLEDTAADKRSRLIDELLNREEYAKFWALKWGDLLKLTSKQIGEAGAYKYYRWLEAAFRDNMPYDQFATELLTASGSTLANPPANFYRAAADTNDCVETISQVFLGARLQCAKCHNHPFERWTQDNYYGLAAFFNRVQRRKTQRPDEVFVWYSNSGEVTQPRTGQQLKPWAPVVGSMDIENDQDRRIAFADWLAKPDNTFFARVEANRIWSQLFSRGIVDPIDDFRDSNPPANAPLLDALADDFVASGFDRKHLLRRILNSRVYQASYETQPLNEGETTYFSHQQPRLLTAEQLLDAVNRTLGTTQKLGPLPAGTLATQVPAPDLVKLDFLKTFGQPERATVCACERTSESNLGMAIELFNGPTIHEKLRDPNNRFRAALTQGSSLEDVIRELYLAALSRYPDDQELQRAMEYCGQQEDKAAAVEDLCWALINTDEFLFQH